MKRIYYSLILLLMAHCALAEVNNVKVIVHADSANVSMSQNILRNVFMGAGSTSGFEPINLPVEHPARVVFNTKIIGLTESRIQSYWAQMRFSGRAKQPVELPSTASVIAFIQENPNAMSYVPADTALPENVVVVFQTTD